MKNRKRVLVAFILLHLIVGTVAFAVAVSDNDGSAFITKAEFDSLKNNFQTQINQYNVSIDSKIDNAISSYLSGINIKAETIESFLGLAHANRRFTRSFTLSNTNRLGDYVEGISCILMTGSNNDTKYMNNSTLYFNDRLLTFDTGYAAQPYKVSVGSNKDTFLYLNNSVWNSSYYTSNSQIVCVPFTAWYGCYVHHGNPPVNTNWAAPANFDISSTRTEWGTQDQYYTAEDSSFGGPGRSPVLCKANALFVSLDEIKQEEKLSYLAGGTVSATNCYTLHMNDRSLLGNNSSDIPINRGWARVRYEGTDPIGAANTWMKTYRLKTYHHKYYNNISLADLVVDSLANVVKIPVRYYSGLPLFKASQDGIVTFTIKITNAGSETSEVFIANEDFDNSIAGSGIQLDSTTAEWSVDGVKSWPSSFTSDQEYEIKMEVKKDVTYYVKVYPASTNYDSVFSIVSDIKNVEKK